MNYIVNYKACTTAKQLNFNSPGFENPGFEFAQSNRRIRLSELENKTTMRRNVQPIDSKNRTPAN